MQKNRLGNFPTRFIIEPNRCEAVLFAILRKCVISLSKCDIVSLAKE